MRSAGRLGLASLLASVAILYGAAGARASASPSLSLMAQSPWVGPAGIFHAQLQVTGASSGDVLQVIAYSRLTTRSGFDQALNGTARSAVIYRAGPYPVSSLAADASGGVDIDIPVDQQFTTGEVPVFQPREGSAVYPLRYQLFDSSGDPLGQAVTTFLVFATGPAASTGLPALSVALNLAIGAPPAVDGNGRPERLPPGESSYLSTVVKALGAFPEVPLTLQLTPEILDALSVGTPSDHATLAILENLVSTGADAVSPAPYVDLDLPAMSASGLAAELRPQLLAGSDSLRARLGGRPPGSTWVVEGAVDSATLSAFVSGGATRVVLREQYLTPLPATVTNTTFAAPAVLQTRPVPQNRSGRVTVYAADRGLEAHFTGSGNQVLAADHLLAELAMIQLETPGLTRGVVVLPPEGWHADPTFVSTLLGGLNGNPLLTPVSDDSLFQAVRLATAEPGGPKLTRGLEQTRPQPPFADARLIHDTRAQLDGLVAIVSKERSLAARLGQRLLVAEAADLPKAARSPLLDSVRSAVRKIEARISLPGSSSITLTARRGSIPITVLSDPSLAARVELRLTSQKLGFRRFNPPGGHCTIERTTTEVCRIVLASEATTLKIPVEARTSGVFPLEVELTSPGGTVVLAANRDTVRSTAVSGVGLVLIVLAALGLAYWWIRDFRHGRRARQLVDPDTGELDLLQLAGEDPHGAKKANGGRGEVTFGAVDPEVEAFFSTEPPRDPGPPGRRDSRRRGRPAPPSRPVSPSRPVEGRST